MPFPWLIARKSGLYCRVFVPTVLRPTLGQRFLVRALDARYRDQARLIAAHYALAIGDLFRQGRIRMPWGNIAARSRLTYLIDEATKYPEHDTTDLIMSTWFGKLAVENLYTPRKSGMYRLDRPSWMGYKARGIA